MNVASEVTMNVTSKVTMNVILVVYLERHPRGVFGMSSPWLLNRGSRAIKQRPPIKPPRR
jgi:hypothetical protein